MEKQKNCKIQYQSKNDTGYRIFEIDFLRGILICLVMLDHLMFDFYYFGGIWSFNPEFLNSVFLNLYKAGSFYWLHPIRYVVREIVILLFFFVSGTSTSFSRNTKVRGLIMLAIGLVLTIFSNIGNAIFQNNLVIDFNIIHALACSMLIYYLLKNKKFFVKIAVVLASILIFIVVTRFDIHLETKLFLPLGITPSFYFYADYVPLVPGLSFFVLGGIVGEKFYQNKTSLLKEKSRTPLLKPLLFMGRNSLFFYFGEQVVLFVLFSLIGFIFFNNGQIFTFLTL